MDDPGSRRKRFVEPYDQNYRRVLAYALTHAEPSTAEDVVSETFLVAWRRLHDVPDPALPWLLGVARNLLQKQRYGGRRRRALAERVAAMTTEQDLVAWDVAEHVVERDAALAAVTAANERDLEVLTLIVWHGLAPREAIRPATKAALYRLLAKQPGIRSLGTVPDQLGRQGVVLAMKVSSGTPIDEIRLTIDRTTGQLLAQEAGDRKAPTIAITYQKMGWVNRLGERP